MKFTFRANSSVVLTLCLLAGMFFSLHAAEAQTTEETAVWLETKLRASETMGGIDITVTGSSIEFTENGQTTTIRWKELTSVHFYPTPAGQPADCRPSCSVATLRFASNGTGKKGSSLPVPGASESDGSRIVKAIQHLAQLNGAKIADDNLF